MTAQVRGGVESIAFEVGGVRLVGILYHAGGAGPHPAAIFLHGIPGSEKNHDMAYVLRELGWHSLLLHFRGSWGSGGAYDMDGQVDDTVGALDWLLGSENPFPVDPSRVALVGYSLGSRAALMAAARDERVRAAVSISGLADFSELALDNGFLEACATVLNGVTARDLSRQWAALGEGDQPTDAVTRIRCPLLVVHGKEDEVVPFFFGEQLARHAGEKAESAFIPGADHLFSAEREEVVEAVVGWLTRTLPG